MNPDLFMELLDSTPKPPDIIPLRLLGLAEMPTRKGLEAAFTRQVKANHPDVNPSGRLTMDELVWARKVLLKKLPEPVTSGVVTSRDTVSRNAEPRTCKGDGCEKTRGLAYRGKWRGYCWRCTAAAVNAEAREARRLARADRACATCYGNFTPARWDGLYCSNACRQRAYRKRRGGFCS